MVNNFCVTNITCPARQYFHFGVCYNVSEKCGDFDYFTGACLSCKDNLNYNLINGTCVLKDVTCGPRQWKSNSVCYDVSSTCGNFDPATGHCLDCVSFLYKLNGDGSCTKIIVVCEPGQYVDGITCVNIPV